jgi:photosystem I subunit 4
MIKKGARVKVLRQESYWFNKIGVVISIEQSNQIRYPVVVRFEAVNYNGTNTNNFSLTELSEDLEKNYKELNEFKELKELKQL